MYPPFFLSLKALLLWVGRLNGKFQGWLLDSAVSQHHTDSPRSVGDRLLLTLAIQDQRRYQLQHFSTPIRAHLQNCLVAEHDGRLAASGNSSISFPAAQKGFI